MDTTSFIVVWIIWLSFIAKEIKGSSDTATST
jgi:hypothetical protein